MAQHDFGGSWTAHRYCHSEARISGQVRDEHGVVSEKRATMIELTFWMRKRHSSYSHRVLSTLSGGCASFSAMALSTGTIPLDALGWVSELCRALRCSVSGNAESIWGLDQQPFISGGGAQLVHRLPRTSDSSTSGGPSAMSSARVPGRMRRAASWSRLLHSFCCSDDDAAGDSWSSGIGGGLGSRGEAGVAVAVAIAACLLGQHRGDGSVPKAMYRLVVVSWRLSSRRDASGARVWFSPTTR